MSINKILLLIFLGIFITACSVKEPRLSFGKKCVEKDNQVVYSYVWVYDKKLGLKADKITCELLSDN